MIVELYHSTFGIAELDDNVFYYYSTALKLETKTFDSHAQALTHLKKHGWKENTEKV